MHGAWLVQQSRLGIKGPLCEHFQHMLNERNKKRTTTTFEPCHVAGLNDVADEDSAGGCGCGCECFSAGNGQQLMIMLMTGAA